MIYESPEVCVNYNDGSTSSTATFTALEISPAGTDAALAPVPAQTGSTGIVAVNLYKRIA